MKTFASIAPVLLLLQRNFKESEHFAYIAAGMMLTAAMLGYVIGAIAAMMGNSIYQHATGRANPSFRKTLTLGGILGCLLGLAVAGYFIFR